MARKKEKKEFKEEVPAWYITFADMVSLLLTFFIVLAVRAKPNVHSSEMQIILSAFNGSLGIFEGGKTLSKGELEDMGMTVEQLPAQEQGKGLAKSVEDATEVFKPEVKSKKVRITQDERGLVISLVGEDHFEPGSARLTPEIKKILIKAGGLLRETESPIRIEGYTDETPIAIGKQGERYETNWELSSQRSINVLRYLHEAEDVDPAKMSAMSYGQYRPMTKSDSPEARSMNRRVDIVILNTKDYKRSYSDDELPKHKVIDDY